MSHDGGAVQSARESSTPIMDATLQTYKASRFIRAVRVTPANLDIVADWCGGVAKTTYVTERPCIDIQTKYQGEQAAYIGDWVADMDHSDYMVMSDECFRARYLLV